MAVQSHANNLPSPTDSVPIQWCYRNNQPQQWQPAQPLIRNIWLMQLAEAPYLNLNLFCCSTRYMRSTIWGWNSVWGWYGVCSSVQFAAFLMSKVLEMVIFYALIACSGNYETKFGCADCVFSPNPQIGFSYTDFLSLYVTWKANIPEENNNIFWQTSYPISQLLAFIEMLVLAATSSSLHFSTNCHNYRVCYHPQLCWG